MTGLDIRTALVPRLGAVGLGWYFVTMPNKVSISPGPDGVDPWGTLQAVLAAEPIPGARLARSSVGVACLVEAWPPPPVETCKESLQVPEPAQVSLW
jgi:hypothetical protein